MRLLSEEGLTLAGGIKTVGDLQAYFFERFRGGMFLVLKNPKDQFGDSRLSKGTDQNRFQRARRLRRFRRRALLQD
jgi:hypothetical protein